MKQIPARLRIILIYVFLILAGAAVFAPVRDHEFIDLDDNRYVTENPQVKAGLTREGLVWAFTSFTYAGNYHPLTWLSHMLDCQLFGLNAGRHHLTGLFFHIINTLLLFYILQKMTGAVWASGLTAALFTVHPLHVESVAWIAERKDVLSGFFWMLTIAAYLRYVRGPNVVRFIPVFLIFGLGLLAKPMLVTLPLVLLLLDYWPLKRFSAPPPDIKKPSPRTKPARIASRRQRSNRQGFLFSLVIGEKIPLLALSAISGAITYFVQQKAGAVKAWEIFPPLARMSNALVSYVGYLVKMVYPNRLAILYPHPGDNLPFWQPIACLVTLTFITLGVIYLGRRHRYLLVGWLWYLGTLAPVIGLVQVGVQARADRYTYLPSVGIFIMAAWAAAEFSRNRRFRRVVLTLAAGIGIVGLMIGARRQVNHWRHSAALFEHCLAVTENNYPLHNNYGSYLCRNGYLDEGIEQFKRCLAINLDHPNAHFNLAQALHIKKDFAGALWHYQESDRLQPDSYETLNNLSWLLATNENAQYRDGGRAVHLARRACELTEYQNPHILGTLAAALAEAGRFSEAAGTIQKAVDLYRRSGQTVSAAAAAGQLQLYRQNKPYREK